MQSLWNEVQNLKSNLGKYEVKTFSSVTGGKSTSVNFSFIPKYIFACGFAKTIYANSQGNYYKYFSLYFGPVANGNSASYSILGSEGDSRPGNPEATLKLSGTTATLTLASTSGSRGQEISNCKVIAI